MAIRKLVAISYCFAFMSVYMLNIAYAMLSGSINRMADEQVLPQTTAMNSTVSAVASFMPSWSMLIVVIGLVALLLAIISIVVSTRSMGAAI